MSDDIGGVWRTIGGRRVFIKDGEDLETAMKNSGKFKFDKSKIDENKKKTEINDTTDEEALEEYINSSYKLNLEAGFIDKDTTYESFKKEKLNSVGDMKFFEDNKEAIKLNIKNRKLEEQKTFDEKSEKYKERRYKDAALKYTCGDYKDIINYQLGKETKGNVEDLKQTTIALEHMSYENGFEAGNREFYRGLQNISTKGLKKGDIMLMRPTISSWTDNMEIAKKFATDNKNSVVIINKNGRYGDINYYNDIRQEDEVIMSGRRNEFKITNIEKEGNITYIYTDQGFYKKKKEK